MIVLSQVRTDTFVTFVEKLRWSKE